MQNLTIFLSIIFLFEIGFYTICAFQWYSYRPSRVIFHYAKKKWHLRFFFVPVAIFYGLNFLSFNAQILLLALILLNVANIFFWYKKLDKKLVFTARIKRFFIFLLASGALGGILKNSLNLSFFPLVCALIFALFISEICEKILFLFYKKKAQKKLENMRDLIIIEITASFGKTSIKNFLFDILKDDFMVYKTPRSVNTLGGLIREINENLNSQTQIFIAEAGARMRGDIAEITSLLSPQIVVVGEIGAQHIEYFKTIENIRATKLEILSSKHLKNAFCHTSSRLENTDKITIYDNQISNIKADLSGVKFELFDIEFFAPILGEFNAENIAVAIFVAKNLGLKIEKIKEKVTLLKSVEHRLQIVPNPKKIIIDDGFNGNFNGMSKSYDLMRNYSGRKVLVTPGIIESTVEENRKLATIANEIFDLVIVTSAINLPVFKEKIDEQKLIILREKSQLVQILSEQTREKDLILFSNDAPSFI